MRYKTAAGMLQYCIDYEDQQGIMSDELPVYFQLLLNAMTPEEDVLVPFVIDKKDVGLRKVEQISAAAVTSNRILIARKKTLGKSVRTIPWKRVEEVAISQDMPDFDIVHIYTDKDDFVIPLRPEESVRVYESIVDALKKFRRARLIRRILVTIGIIVVAAIALFITYKLGYLPIKPPA
jgi:hypothetical protein